MPLEEEYISSSIVAPSPKQIDACATAYVDACLKAIKTGAPHTVAYSEKGDVFRACQWKPVEPADFLLEPISREEAIDLATAYGIDMHSPDAEENFRKVVFIDNVNRPAKATLASDFLSGFVPRA